MKHQFKLAIGNLKKSSLTTILNLTGLTGAFVAFLMIMLYVWHEYHFDCYNSHVNEICRIETKFPDDTKSSVYLMGATGQTLKEEFPEIIASTIYMPWGKWGEETFRWQTSNGKVKEYEDYAYSDEKLTEIFSFNFVKGKRERPLLEPQSAIISESFARKAWGNDDPTGKQLEAGNSLYTVAAVFADPPENSVVQCPIILKLPAQGKLGEEAKEWGLTNYPQFLLVKPGTDRKLLAEKINKQSIVKSKYRASQFKVSPELILRPLRDLHFTELAESYSFSSIGSKKQLYVNSLFFVGILIILIALINHINFATANVPQRIKSISITRIIGSSRSDVVKVYMIETLLMLAFSFLIAFVLSYLLNRLFSKSVFGYTPPFAENLQMLLMCGAGCMIFGLFAGVYPGLYSTSEKPIDALKRFSPRRRINFRGVLTVSQFVATIALIVVSITVIRQVRFMEDADLGYNKNSTMVIELNDELKKNSTVFENNLKQCPGISDFAYSFAVPGREMSYSTLTVDDKQCPVWFWAVDAGYLDMMGFQLVKGRKFIKSSQAEEGSLICNETAAKKYGWELGTKTNNGILVGILKDFNYVSLQKGVDPFVFWYSNSAQNFRCVSLKLSNGPVAGTIATIRKAFDKISPDTPLKYYFLDEHLNLLYLPENQQAKLITSFCLLSVLVSVLGLLGLSIFIIQSKVKEVGIRKVNGAKVIEVMTMLNQDFIKWVAIAFAFATPLSWYITHKWLENFAYKISLSWWIFALAGAIALGIALLAVSWQSWKAATRNPVEALRYE